MSADSSVCGSGTTTLMGERRAAEAYARASVSTKARGVRIGSSPAEREEVLVAGDEDRSLRLGEREEVVVARIGGATRGRLGVGCAPRCRREARRTRWPPLRGCACGSSGRRAHRELREERLRDDKLEPAGEPARDELRRRSASGEERGDENARVEDGAHSAAAGACLVLGLDRELQRLPLAEIVCSKDAPAGRNRARGATPLDYLAVALPCLHPPHLDRTQNLLVDREVVNISRNKRQRDRERGGTAADVARRASPDLSARFAGDHNADKSRTTRRPSVGRAGATSPGAPDRRR